MREGLADLHRRTPQAHAKCVARIQRLAELGHELRRPESDYLRNGIHELRARKGNVNYRILYFFHGARVVILAHALTKESTVPATDIQRALIRRERLLSEPDVHIHEG